MQHLQLETEAAHNQAKPDQLKHQDEKMELTDNDINKDQIQQERALTFIGASKDLATLTITGVKNTQKMSYTKSPPQKWKRKNAFRYECNKRTENDSVALC